LVVTELLCKRFELLIDEDDTVGRQLEQLRVRIRVVERLEVRVVEDEELLRPARSAGCVRGIGTVRELLLVRTVGELGLFLTKTRSVLVRTAECVSTTEGNDSLRNS
jgi:hypothetical protein